MSEEKENLRKEALRHRERMHFSYEDPNKATDHFFSTFSMSSFNVIAGYWPKGKEFDCSPILETFLKEGKECVLPVVKKDTRILHFARWKDGEPLIEGPYKIKQPTINEETEWLEPDLVIVPLLAFDRRGHRLGYGGGYYDATLEFLRKKKDIVAVGLAYSQQACLFPLPTDEHDQRLDYVITPQTIHSFSP